MFERGRKYIMDYLNKIYKKNKGKKYIIEELRAANFEEGHYGGSTFYATISPFGEFDSRKNIEIAMYLDEEKLNLSLIGKYGEIHINTKIPEDCFIYPTSPDGKGLKILDFVQGCVLRIYQNVDFCDIEKAEKILSEYSENY